MKFKSNAQRKAVMAKLRLNRVPYGIHPIPEEKREFQIAPGSPVGTQKEWKDYAKKEGYTFLEFNDHGKRKIVRVDEDKKTVSRPEKMTRFDTIKLANFEQKLESGRRLHFQSKEVRDEVYKKLRGKMDLKRKSIHGQILHPQYIADYEGQVETGIGNTQYKTMFPTLYELELKR